MKTCSTIVAHFAALWNFVGQAFRVNTAIAALGAVAIAVTPAQAQLWDEQANGGGDAGKLPSELQITVGSGPLSIIGGTISNPDVDIDMYCIRITDKASFKAVFDETLDPFKRFALWLFDSTGKPIAHAVDNSAVLPYHVQIDSTHVPTNGLYFLAIGVYTFDPRAGGNAPMFPPLATGQSGGIPVAGPIASWVGLGCCGGGPYAIKISGATYHMPPTNGGSGTGPCWTYTTKLDFSQGFLFNLSTYIDPETGKVCLRLDDPAKAWPFIAAPISVNGGTIRPGAAMRIAVQNLPLYQLNEGDVLGEYITRPAPSRGNPSRTTVDPYGNIWITNRFDDIVLGAGNIQGSVARIGLALGGQRWNKTTNLPDPNGDYLKGPFQYCTCEDRDNDGLIKTSRGYSHTTGALNADYKPTLLPWGATTAISGVQTAQDECITAWVRVRGSGARHVSIDKNNDIWVGGYTDGDFEKLDGATAQSVPGTPFSATLGPTRFGGYGGLVDPFNVVWSSGFNLTGGVMRFDTAVPGSQKGLGFPGIYGMALDALSCRVWGHDRFSDQLREFLPNGTLNKTIGTGGANGSGLVISGAWAWAGNNSTNSVRRVRTAFPNDTYSVPLTLGTISGFQPHGLTTDSNGKVWTFNLATDNTLRIDPNAGPPNTGAVDLAVDLGSFAYPYTYSDASGREHITGSAPQGSWTFIHDGGLAGSKWGTLNWSATGTPGTYVLARVRASDNVLPSGPWTNVTSGVAFTGVIGRYLQVQITLVRPAPCNGGGDIKLCSLSICKEPGCYVKLGEILCPTTASPNGLTINATVTNNGSVTVKKVRISPSVGSPVSFNPHTVNTTILPGKSANIQTKAFGWTTGQQFCFTVTLVDETNQDCCSTEVCATPACDCLQVPASSVSVACDFLNGNFIYKFSFDNLTASKIYHVYLDPPAGITFDPSYIQFPTGISPGASSGPITIKIKGASLGQTIPFLLSIHYLYLGECCSRSLSVTMPKSCFSEPVDPGSCCPPHLWASMSAYTPAWPANPKLILSISNPSDQPKAFDWEVTELPIESGYTAELLIGTLTPWSGTTPVIQPGGSLDVAVSFPTGLIPPNLRAGVRAAVFDHATGEAVSYSIGEVVGSFEFAQDGFASKARVRASSDGVLSAPVGVPTVASFEITNDGAAAEVFQWQVLATNNYVSLGGDVPGGVKSGTIPIPAGQTAVVQVPLTVVSDPGTAIPFAAIRVRPNVWFYPPQQVGASISFRSGSACPSDLNADGVVDDSDFPAFVFAYSLLACEDPAMPPGCAADLNGDGVVDDGDFNIFVEAYNTHLCP